MSTYLAGSAEFQQALLAFDPRRYWADKEFKVWVVTFENRARLKRPAELVFVRARDKDGAQATAVRHRPDGGRLRSVRLATPFDLGCDQVTLEDPVEPA